MDNNNLHFQDSGSSFTPPPPPPPPPMNTGGYNTGGYNTGGYQQQSSGSASSSAIWALVLGIASWVLCGIFAAVPAWIMGKKEISRIQAGQSDPAGKTMAQIGMWLGIIQVILGILALIVVMIIILLGGFASLMNSH